MIVSDTYGNARSDGGWDSPLLYLAQCVISFAQCTPVKIIIGGKILDVRYSHAIMTVAPLFSLSTWTTLPTRLIPVGAISFSPKEWKRRKVSSAFTTTSTLLSLNFFRILALFACAFSRQSIGTIWDIVIFRTDQ